MHDNPQHLPEETNPVVASLLVQTGKWKRLMELLDFSPEKMTPEILWRYCISGDGNYLFDVVHYLIENGYEPPVHLLSEAIECSIAYPECGNVFFSQLMVMRSVGEERVLGAILADDDFMGGGIELFSQYCKDTTLTLRVCAQMSLIHRENAIDGVCAFFDIWGEDFINTEMFQFLPADETQRSFIIESLDFFITEKAEKLNKLRDTLSRMRGDMSPSLPGISGGELLS